MRFSTRAIHVGEEPTKPTGAVVPIYQVSTFRQSEPGVEGEYVYARKKSHHILAVEDLYGGTRRLFDRIMRNFGIEFSYFDGTNVRDLEAGFRPETKMVWLETPTNPLLKIIDISASAKIGHDHNALLAVDNTFMSPYLQQPLKLGAHIVVHSTTKYLGGHGDLIGGAVIVSDPAVYEKVRFAENAVGAVPGPLDCWLVLRGSRRSL